MRPLATNTGVPPIPTAGTRQLARQAGVLRRRIPQFDEHVAAIRGGDTELLSGYVRRAQAGDADAAQLALWALFPRMCAVIRSRIPRELRKPAADDCLALLYLTMLDVAPDESSLYLADKLVTRTRRRYERSTARRTPTPSSDAEIVAVGPVGDDVEAQALARVELDELCRAVSAGLISERSWHLLVGTQLRDSGDNLGAPARMKIMRARRRLGAWRGLAA
jgi:hypothetical protein